MINVFFEIEGGGIRDIGPGIIRDHGHVIPHLVLLGIPEERIERVAHGDVGRPSHSSVRAVGVEELRVGIVRGVARIQPDGIDPPIRRDGKRPHPMPFAGIDSIIVNPRGRTEGRASVGAARESHVGAAGCAGWPHTG